MKQIWLIKQTTVCKLDGSKTTAVLNAFTSKEAARKFIDEMIELDNQMNLRDFEYSYQITPIKLFD